MRMKLRFEQQNSEGKTEAARRSRSVMLISIGAFLAAGVMLFSIFQVQKQDDPGKTQCFVFATCLHVTIIGVVYLFFKSKRFTPSGKTWKLPA